MFGLKNSALMQLFALFLATAPLNVRAAEIISLLPERDTTILKLNDAEIQQIKSGDKILIFVAGRKDPLSATVQDVLDGKAKISVFEGTGFLSSGAVVSLQRKEVSEAEKAEKKKVSDNDEKMSKAKVQIVSGLLAFALGGILLATLEDERNYDSCPSSASSAQNGSYSSCVATVDAHNSSLALQKGLQLLAMTVGAVSVLVGYNNYAEGEKLKNKGTSVTFRMNF